MEVISFTAYASDKALVEAIKAFFEANNVDYVQENAVFPFDKAKEQAIYAKVQEAIGNGTWAILSDSERQDFVLGAIVEQADTSNIMDANTMKNKIKQRLNDISSYATV